MASVDHNLLHRVHEHEVVHGPVAPENLDAALFHHPIH